jgi:hypothetical protein
MLGRIDDGCLEKPFAQDVILKPECWDLPECSDLMVVSGLYSDWRQLLGVIFDREMAEIASPKQYARNFAEEGARMACELTAPYP